MKAKAQGGKREGSGRKKLGRITIQISILPKTARALQRKAALKQTPVGYIVDELI